MAALSERLAELLAEHPAPGASVAVLRDGALTTAAAGVLHAATRAPVTPDSVFQLGSLSKTYTATLLMTAVDEGLVDLDAPVVEHLPELRLRDRAAREAVTLRHLLSHTSGVDGDLFVDTGRGSDALERYLPLVADLEQLFPPGQAMSYGNAGYVVAARLAEVVLGADWDALLRARVLEPAGLGATMTLPEEALLHGAAVGHLSIGGQLHRAPMWGLPRALGPAGGVCATAADAVRFAALHLRDGAAESGRRVLESSSVKTMQSAQVDVPDRWRLGSSWGVGWMLWEHGGRTVFGHDGNTIGQSAYLRAVPEAGVAVALLTNGPSYGLFRALVDEVLRDAAGVGLPEPPAAAPAERLEPLVGRYRRAGVDYDVAVGDGRLVLTTTVTGPLALVSPEPVKTETLQPCGGGVFTSESPADGFPNVYAIDGARVFAGGRYAPRA